MKKFFLLLSITEIALFGVVVKKDDISVLYKPCLKYGNMVFGLPYCIQITNATDKGIIVDQNIVDVPLATHQEVVQALRNEYKLGALLSALLTTMAGSLSYSMFRGMQPSPNAVFNPPPGTDLKGKIAIYGNTPLYAKINLGSAIAGGFLTTYLLYKLAAETKEVLEHKLKKEFFNLPITIQPGETIEKLFWLKNPNDQVRINFDAIKALK